MPQIGVRPTFRQPNPARGDWDYEKVAVELVRALRGRRSQAAFSRRLGYRSSAVHRWEAGESWPTAAEFLARCEAVPIDLPAAYERFFQRRPSWIDDYAPGSLPGVGAFLQQLRGKIPIGSIAMACGHNRYTVSRWFRGVVAPKLPDFLCLVEVCSRRLLDFIETFVDPNRLPSLRLHWQQLQRMREVAYEAPWSHAVLRALEIQHPNGDALVPWLARTLGISAEESRRALHLLKKSGHVDERNGSWNPIGPVTVNTGHNAAQANALRVTWARIAVERMAEGVPGHCGYSLFAIARRDLVKLRDLHVQYIRAMQDIIAASSQSECVALFCAQLFDLNSSADSALSTLPETRNTSG